MAERRRQCEHCPWKVTTDPRRIPNGYSVRKHRGLKDIATPGSTAQLFGPQKIMACHKTPVGAEQPCAGWLVNQLGPGNNIALRLRVIATPSFGDVETVGEQLGRFEDTLPKRWRPR